MRHGGADPAVITTLYVTTGGKPRRVGTVRACGTVVRSTACPGYDARWLARKVAGGAKRVTLTVR